MRSISGKNAMRHLGIRGWWTKTPYGNEWNGEGRTVERECRISNKECRRPREETRSVFLPWPSTFLVRYSTFAFNGSAFSVPLISVWCLCPPPPNPQVPHGVLPRDRPHPLRGARLDQPARLSPLQRRRNRRRQADARAP